MSPKTLAEVFDFAFEGILQEPIIDGISKINLAPEDFLIVNLSQPCPREDIREFADCIGRMFPTNRVLVVFDKITLSKLPRDELLKNLRSLVKHFERLPEEDE